MFLRWLWWCIAIGVLLAPNAYAQGTYWVGRDDQGVYLQTDQGKSWYIGRSDLRFFSAGEQGQYRIGSDSQGTYIQLGKPKKFYVEDISSANADADKDLQAHQYGPTSPVGNKHESRVALVGNQVLVPVKIISETRRIEVFMLLDTGAGMTVLHSNVADKLELKPFKKAYAQVVGGSMIPMAMAKVKRLEVGGIQKKGCKCRHHRSPGGENAAPRAIGNGFSAGSAIQNQFSKTDHRVGTIAPPNCAP